MFTHEIRNGIAWVTFDSGGMNTLSAAAVEELDALVAELQRCTRRRRSQGVILKGNRFGLGAGANIGELMPADARAARRLHRRGPRRALRDRGGPAALAGGGRRLRARRHLRARARLPRHRRDREVDRRLSRDPPQHLPRPRRHAAPAAPQRPGQRHRSDERRRRASPPSSPARTSRRIDAAAIHMVDAVIPAGDDADALRRALPARNAADARRARRRPISPTPRR